MLRRPGLARLMLVEDEAIVALTTALSLREMDYEVCGVAATRNDGLQLAEIERPDLAVIDVRLAEGPVGALLARELRRRWNIPSLLVTARPELIDTASKGPLVALRKPFSSRHLIEAVALGLDVVRYGRLPPRISPFIRVAADALPGARRQLRYA